MRKPLPPMFPFVLAILLNSQFAMAQSPAVDFGKMTPEERNAYFAKIREASEVDWRAMMNQLGLKEPTLPPADKDPNRPAHLVQREGSSNWYDAEGNTHVRSGWGVWSNYDEAKAGPYTLPDPLVLKNGRLVRTATEWWKLRRPEILHDYLTEIYGRTPANTPQVTFEVTETDPKALEGRAVKKTIVGHIDNSRYPQATPSIEITLYTPAKATGRLPLIVQVSGGFERFFPKPDGPTALDMTLEKGWAFATVNTGAIQADNGMGLKEGIIGLMNEGKLRKPDEWGVLAAWCWGLSRALDYFETNPSIHPKQIGIEGHSRWGKTALLAAALDSRWAITYASCSGAMGASLEKRSWGETIDNVAGAGEYHWMAGNFLKYGGNWAAMPVDAHELMALVAPRPLFVTGGTKDQWSDPHGEFLACVAAGPVYRLLGKKDLGTTQMPAPDVSLLSGDLTFRNHEGGHTDLPDWPVFLQFASRYFGPVKTAAGK